MFETFIKNARYWGHVLLIYSWVIGILTFLMLVVITHEIGDSLVIGAFMWVKWAIIGFVIELFANMFLVDITKDK